MDQNSAVLESKKITIVMLFAILFSVLACAYIIASSNALSQKTANVLTSTPTQPFSSLDQQKAAFDCPGVDSACGFWISPTCDMRITQDCALGNQPGQIVNAVDFAPDSACGKPVYAPIDGEYVGFEKPPPQVANGGPPERGYYIYPSQTGCTSPSNPDGPPYYVLTHMREVVYPGKKFILQGTYIGTIGCFESAESTRVSCHAQLSAPEEKPLGYNPFCGQPISEWESQKDALCLSGK